MSFHDGRGRQQTVSRVFVGFRKRGHSRPWTRFDAESLSHRVAGQNAIFDRFIQHMNIGCELFLCAAAHGMLHGSLFLGEGFQRHVVDLSAMHFHDHGDCFVFGQHQ